MGSWASLEAARPWVTRQETNTLSSAPIGNSVPVTWPPAHLLTGLETKTQKRTEPVKQQEPWGLELCAQPALATQANLIVSAELNLRINLFSRRSGFMTSRQSEWCKPGDAQGNSIPGWGINQLCGHGQVIFPQWGGVPGWAGLLYGRPQAERPADLQSSASWKSVPPRVGLALNRTPTSSLSRGSPLGLA